MPQKNRLPLLIFVAFLVMAFLLLTSINMGLLTHLSALNTVFFSPTIHVSIAPSQPATKVPCFAYLISGTKGDIDSLWRILLAIYHPRNIYLMHLDFESPAAESQHLSGRVASNSLFSSVGNVHVNREKSVVTYLGSTMVASTLHACAILLRKSKDWDWFINLSASDYPLVTQDDLLFTFSKLPKNLNFLEHTRELEWKLEQRAKPLVIDRGLYTNKKSNLFWVPMKRELPNAFKLFTGSAWVALTREFVEFSILGWDNLPRTLLMYYTNSAFSHESYFHTVICNSEEFNTTVVNHDLHYISWDNPPKQHPHILSLIDIGKMIGSNSPFARMFRKNDPVLNEIDAKFLQRTENEVIPGGWCAGTPACSNVSDPEMVIPGPGAKRLANLMEKLVWSGASEMNRCK